MLYIEVPDMNDSMSSVTIDDVEYQIRMTYNEIGDFWLFGLYKDDDTPIVAMTKVIPNFPFMYCYRDERLPDGVWGVISDVDHVGRDTFNEGLAELVFISRSDLVDGAVDSGEEEE